MARDQYSPEVKKFINKSLLNGMTNKNVQAQLKTRFPDRFRPDQQMSGQISAYKHRLGLPVRKMKPSKQSKPMVEIAQPNPSGARESLVKAMVIYLQSGHAEKAKAISNLL